MNATAITRFLASPVHQANNSVINATAAAYSCMLDLCELGLRLTGRIELDADAPIVWIDPPPDPVQLFGRYAIVAGDHHPTLKHLHKTLHGEPFRLDFEEQAP